MFSPSRPKLLFISALLAFGANASAVTIQINFGTDSGLADWNEAGNGATSNIADLFDSTSTSTGISLTWTDNLGNSGTSATSSPTPPASNLFPGAVTSKYAYGTGGDAASLGVFELGGLDSNTYYTFYIFATRSTTEARETEYTISGSTTEVQNLIVGNNLSNYLTFSNMSPDGSGNISVSLVDVGVNQWSYINGMVIETTPIPEPATIGLVAAVGALAILRRRRR